MITVDALTVEFGGTTLFKDVSFQINPKDRIALMGKNGAGKSTLLKILAGVRTATRGSVSMPKDCVVAYLPQHLLTEDKRTVFDETCQAFAHLHEIQAQIDRINNQLTTRTDYESPDYMLLIEKLSALSERFYAIDMTHFEEDVEKTLLGLGFQRSDFNRPTSQFSGGWRMRIELAKLLLRSPDVLLLDEPTNHLDIQSIQWLEQFITNSSKAVVVISHDRKFIDNITTRTMRSPSDASTTTRLHIANISSCEKSDANSNSRNTKNSRNSSPRRATSSNASRAHTQKHSRCRAA